MNLVPHLSTVYLKQVTYNFLRLQLIISVWDTVGFSGDSDGKESARNAGKLSSIPGSGRSPREGNGNPLHYSCLENPMDGGAWQTIAHRLAMSWTRLSDFTHSLTHSGGTVHGPYRMDTKLKWGNIL